MSKCDLIRDLLPLYVDGAASKESARAVEAHVAQCPECRQALEDMRAPNPPPAPVVEDVNFAAALGQLRKTRGWRRAKYILLGMAAAAVMLILGMFLKYQLTENCTRQVPLEDYDIRLVQLANQDFVVIYDVPEVDLSFNTAMSLSTKIWYFSIQCPPICNTSNVTERYIEDFGPYDGALGEGVLEIRKGTPDNYEVVYRAGDAVPPASEALEAYYNLYSAYQELYNEADAMAEQLWLSPERIDLERILKEQIGLDGHEDQSEAQPTATP